MWKNVTANSNLIQIDHGNSILIKLPKSELMFWHPKKCVRTSGKGGYRMSIGYTDEFEIEVFRNGKGRHNFKDVIEKRKISIEEFEKAFQ